MRSLRLKVVSTGLGLSTFCNEYVSDLLMNLFRAKRYPIATCWIVIVVTVAVSSGCTPPRYVASSNQEEGTRKLYQQGLELLVSQEEQNTVIAGLQRLTENEKHMQLILLVQNQGDSAFNVNPTKIDVLFEQEGNSERLPIYPPDEAVDKITFDERLAAALNAAAASYNQNTDINTETNRDLAQGSALAAIAEGKNVQSTLLRRETLFAGNEIAGAVYFALNDSGRLQVTIPAGRESHTFYFVSDEN